MFFMPYRADLDLPRLPVVTILIALLCIATTYLQYAADRAAQQAIGAFCAEKPPRMLRLALDTIEEPHWRSCDYLAWRFLTAGNPADLLDEVASQVRMSTLPPEQSRAFALEELESYYHSFKVNVLERLTPRLWYPPESWSPWRMLTATFAHGSWQHVAGNVYFFFAFAAAVEAMLGAVAFLGAFGVLAVGTAVAYSMTSIAAGDLVPTVGLSGVVMGMMGFFFTTIPRTGIRCVLWLGVMFKRFTLPAWLLFAWYLGWDVYYVSQEGQQSNVNYVAHISGALIGCALAALFLLWRRWRV